MQVHQFISKHVFDATDQEWHDFVVQESMFFGELKNVELKEEDKTVTNVTECVGNRFETDGNIINYSLNRHGSR